MQKRGRPPSPYETEQVTVRLAKTMVDRFKKAAGVSKEIQERLWRSVYDEERDQQFRVFAGKMEELAKAVRHTLGVHWYEDRNAHQVFVEVVRQLLADLPVPGAEISELPTDVKAIADLLYRRYASELREIETGGKPKPRVSPSARHSATPIDEDKS
jgi:hypothetical protein